MRWSGLRNKALLVLTKAEFIEALRCGKVWRRRQGLEQRQVRHAPQPDREV
jgi:hypothetical protein